MKLINSIACNGIIEKHDFNTIRCYDVFKQILIDKKFELPCQKLDIEGIVSIQAEPEIIDKREIETPLGKKIILHGILKIKITYTARVPEQSVHSAHFTKEFSTFIKCNFYDECYNETNLESLDVKIFIEDCEARYMNEREFRVATLLLIALKKGCKKCECNLIASPSVNVEILSAN